MLLIFYIYIYIENRLEMSDLDTHHLGFYTIFYVLLKLQHCHHGTRKQDLIASLLSSYEDGLCPLLQRAILNKTGTCVRISCKAESLVWRALRLFFLNGEQDLSAFLLVDLGIVKYPTYNCIISDQIFPGLNDLLAYEEAIEVAQIMDEALDDKNSGLVLRCISISNSRLFISCSKSTQSSASESAATFLSCLSASWVYSKVVLLGISFLERERRYWDKYCGFMAHKEILKLFKRAGNALKLMDWQHIQQTCGEHKLDVNGSLTERFLKLDCDWCLSSTRSNGHRYDDAVHLLKRLLDGFTCDGRRGYWTLRLSVDLEHLGRLNESLSVAEDGLLDPWVRAGSRMALQRRVLRLGKPPRRWKTPCYSEAIKRKIIEVHVQGRPLNCETGMKSRFYGEDGEQCGVEQLALQYYAGEGGGWQGVHTESGIWLTIFGLLMWDIIFADVPNVFHTRFQVWLI
ncbi:Fanconi-associated nuclease 1-like [Vitis vinifera]|uniref:Fanconi-associated nuclease n=1 Tax=Vitis vinifera TaxID=29760 RepID=A0A438HDR5_VITVI|nr:Fanconi-associated nuclease 1-like [Vitis vinifera]